MAFYCLDASFDENKSTELGRICSEMNPFLWTDDSSADPAMWEEFCDLCKDGEYTMAESYDAAKRYIASLNSRDAVDAINAIDIDGWKGAYAKYVETAGQSKLNATVG